MRVYILNNNEVSLITKAKIINVSHMARIVIDTDKYLIIVV